MCFEARSTGRFGVVMRELWAVLTVAMIMLVACSTNIQGGSSAGASAPVSDADILRAAAVSQNAPPSSTLGNHQGVAAETSPGPLQTSSPAAFQDQRETIFVSMSMYLLVDDTENPNPQISTRRTEDDLRQILDGMNEIWSQANIRLEPRFIGTIEVPEEVLIRVTQGDLRGFFDGVGNTIEVPRPSIINGFYARRIGGSNGINPRGGRAFFVIDEPSVHDRRVSSHEVGHIFGLHHARSDTDRLLFSGTNGMTLTEDEIVVARYVARGILDGLR